MLSVNVSFRGASASSARAMGSRDSACELLQSESTTGQLPIEQTTTVHQIIVGVHWHCY